MQEMFWSSGLLGGGKSAAAGVTLWRIFGPSDAFAAGARRTLRRLSSRIAVRIASRIPDRRLAPRIPVRIWSSDATLPELAADLAAGAPELPGRAGAPSAAHKDSYPES